MIILSFIGTVEVPVQTASSSNNAGKLPEKQQGVPTFSAAEIPDPGTAIIRTEPKAKNSTPLSRLGGRKAYDRFPPASDSDDEFTKEARNWCRGGNTTSTRSPTPPAKKKPDSVATTKKGLGRSTITTSAGKTKNVLSNSGPPTKKQKKNDGNSDSLCEERFKVLKNLSESLAREEAREEGGVDDDMQWSNSLGRKIKRVDDKILKEQTVAVMNAIMSYSVIGERHPALDLMFPQHAHQTFQPQHQATIYPMNPYFFTNPMYGAPGPSKQPLQQQQQQYHQQPQQPQQQQQLNTSVPTSSQQISSQSNAQTSIAQTYAAGPTSQGYVPSTNEYPFSLTPSPLKNQPIICHTLNTFGPAQQPGQQGLEFAQL